MTESNETLATRFFKHKRLHLRAAKIALVVGSILAAINYGDKIAFGQMHNIDWLKMALTYCVPYCVSIFSALAAIKQNSHPA